MIESAGVVARKLLVRIPLLKNDGTLWAFGRNNDGQLGIVPQRIAVAGPDTYRRKLDGCGFESFLSSQNRWFSLCLGS